LRSYRYLHLDVFTDRLFGGNQLAVFLDGRGLPAATMQAIAKEMNFSETTFVLPAERPDTDLRLRIFTPGEELPMAGHPTVGTVFALARAGVVAPPVTSMTVGLTLGPTPVSLVWRQDELRFVWMTQLLPTFGEPLGDSAAAAASLRLPPASVNDTGLPVQVVSCGVPFLFIPLTGRRAVDSAIFDAVAYGAFRHAAGVEDLPIFLFSPEAGADDGTVYSRMFAAAVGVSEDPATGGACGALGGYLVKNKVVTLDRAGAMLNVQGVKMGRPSCIHIASAPTAARSRASGSVGNRCWRARGRCISKGFGLWALGSG
jgi:trans-2,3-dihydro-3-hydroxyanthranilate isomerase